MERGTGILVAVVALWLGAAPPLAAQGINDPTKPAPTPPTAPPAPGPPSPFTFTAAYTADLLDDLDGGARIGQGYVDLLKLSAAYDGGLVGHEGLSGLVSLTHVFGSSFTASHVGGLQDVSASEAQPGDLRLYEMWLRQSFADGRAGVKAGLIDINTTFDVQETAALFLNASDGIGPDLSDTGKNGPSDYPTPALAVTSFYRPAEGWTAQLGVFDGVAGDPAHRNDFVAVQFDGALIIGQVEKRWGDAARIEVGAWTYTSRFQPLGQPLAAGAVRRLGGNDGAYGLVEGRLLKAGDGGLSGWVRLGLADGAINPIDSYMGAGLVYTGLIKGRDKDEIGVSLMRAGLGSGARDAGALAGREIGDAETDLETTYRFVFADWLNIQPDLQYVISPHGDRNSPNALVGGVRFAFLYSK